MTEPLRITRIDTRRDDVREALDALREKLSPRGNIVSEEGRRKTIEVFGEPLSPQQVVERICADIRQRGLPALLTYCEKLDRATLTGTTLRVSAEELRRAHEQADPTFLATVRRIRDNVLEFQRAILHQDVEVTRPGGVRLRQRYVPLERIGICVPGGAAAYPSTVLMTAVPAVAAGVREIVVVAPPTKFGANNPDVLATCHEIGVTEVYRMGGAQAVADMLGGHIQMNFGTTATLLALIRQGRLRALAVTGDARNPDLPDVPTMAESGYSALTLRFWNAIWAPPRTPAEIVEKLNVAISEGLKSPEVSAAMARAGFEPMAMTVQAFAAFVASESPKSLAVARTSGVKGD